MSIITDIGNVIALNQTSVSESVSPELNILIGVLFIFIGIMFMFLIYTADQKNKKQLKRF